jgi:hypothetical protein
VACRKRYVAELGKPRRCSWGGLSTGKACGS